MKKILFALMFTICTSASALTGMKEFIMVYPDEELRFIHDGAYMIVLKASKIADDRNSTARYETCLMSPIVNNESVIGKNKIVFYDYFAIINDKKKRPYVGRKTDLLFYRHLCKKPE